MKIGILKYPGGHGEVELMHMLSGHFNKDVREIWYKESGPFDVDILFIGGGFPCREGKDGLTCLNNSPAINHLPEFASGGNYIIGFGNGFQLLCEAKLLPGKLVNNASGRFICKQVFIKPENHSNIFTRGLSHEKILRIPLATNFGRYSAEESVLMKMRQDEQILFRFCDYEGRITEAVNYTGAHDNIAMVCNSGKNVFGLIAQPERVRADFIHEADGSELIGSFLNEVSI